MWGNPRARYVGILRVISELRTRQPRDGQMKCGNQPANISMINRRQSLPRVAFPFRCEIQPIRNRRHLNPSADPRALRSCLLTARGHINVRNGPFLEITPSTSEGTFVAIIVQRVGAGYWYSGALSRLT